MTELGSGSAPAEPATHPLESKVAAVTPGFWLIKVLATTLGETAGDAVTMSMNLGYAMGTGIFGAIFIAAVSAQIGAKKFHPFLFWLVIVATTTVGTTMADFFDRSLHIGYLGGSSILFSLLMLSLFVWHRTLGTINVNSLFSRKAEIFYWITVLFSQTLGTALGDWVADDDSGLGLGYAVSAMAFGTALAIIAALYFWTKTNRTGLFWAAFILSRPLGATVGDFLDKPIASGGLALSRYSASAVLAVLMILCVVFIPQKAEKRA
jgi:uncharacterized membrane-anchored protein